MAEEKKGIFQNLRADEGDKNRFFSEEKPGLPR